MSSVIFILSLKCLQHAILMSFSAVVDCGPLDDPENGDVSVSGTRVGSSAFYYCFTGYRLIGSSFRTCLSSGNWSGSAPICQGKCLNCSFI